MCRWLLISILVIVIGEISTQRVAKVKLQATNISGRITFTETNDGVRVTGTITGLNAGLYGFHIHESGDISTCYTSGAHYNPGGTTHGGPDHKVRHVGDLGNVQFQQDGTATVNIVDSQITLRGRNSILGRTLVLHEGQDDLGQGGNEGSLTTGNAGARVACGVVGISDPLEAWNSGVAFMPVISLMYLAVSLVVMI